MINSSSETTNGGPCAKLLTVWSRRWMLTGHPLTPLWGPPTGAHPSLSPPNPTPAGPTSWGMWGQLHWRSQWQSSWSRACVLLVMPWVHPGDSDAPSTSVLPPIDTMPWPSPQTWCHRKPLQPSPFLRTTGIARGENYKSSVRKRNVWIHF